MGDLIYLDSNAVTKLWNDYVRHTGEGSSELDYSLTPFKNAVISEYVLDEMLMVENQDSVKRHAAFITIFQRISLLKAITTIIKEGINNPSDFYAPANLASSVAISRLTEVLTGELSGETKKALEEKQQFAEMCTWYQQGPQEETPRYMQPEKREDIRTVIKEILSRIGSANPMNLKMFNLLCMELYVAKRQRKIKKPTGIQFYKANKHTFNDQIDFYHLSYLPLVNTFISGDEGLLYVAQEIVNMGLDDCKIVHTGEYWKNWLKDGGRK